MLCAVLYSLSPYLMFLSHSFVFLRSSFLLYYSFPAFFSLARSFYVSNFLYYVFSTFTILVLIHSLFLSFLTYLFFSLLFHFALDPFSRHLFTLCSLFYPFFNSMIVVIHLNCLFCPSLPPSPFLPLHLNPLSLLPSLPRPFCPSSPLSSHPSSLSSTASLPPFLLHRLSFTSWLVTLQPAAFLRPDTPIIRFLNSPKRQSYCRSNDSRGGVIHRPAL